TRRGRMRRSWMLAALAAAATAMTLPNARADGVPAVSFTAGGRDAAGAFMGGTELRNLLACHGRLDPGNGYWEARPGEAGRQGAQVLVLDAPGAAWRVEHGLDEWIARERRRDLAISALACIDFSTDGAGAPLRSPVSFLLASAWDLTGATQEFS